MDSNIEVPAGCLPIYTVDSFSSKPFAGNPAAVCLEDPSMNLTDVTRQNIAREMNISETAFLQIINPDDSFKNASRFKLRWMTPTREVPLCGHATLATSAVLFDCVKNIHPELRFETLSGELIARRAGDNICLDLPLNPPEPFQDRAEIKELLKLVLPDPEEAIQEIQYSPTMHKLLIRLKDSYTRTYLEELTPEFSKFTTVHNSGTIWAVIVTLCTEGREKYDFVSRFFGPWFGIPEDPVTGAAHTVLAPYWSKQLGKKELFARQCSARGGDLYLTVRDDGRLDVAGPACLVLAGHIRVQ